MMNTVNRDRNILKRLVESYGVKDIENFVNHINEEETYGLENKEEILNKYFKKVYSILAKTSNSDGIHKIFTQMPFAKGVIIDSIFGPLYDKGSEAYTKIDEMPNFKMYMMQVTNTYMMRFITNINNWLNNHFNIPNDGKYSYELKSNSSFRYIFVEIFKAAMSEAKQEIEAKRAQEQEDADIQAGLDAKPGDFEDFDSANQDRDLISAINNRGQKLQDAKYSHVVKATENYITIKTDTSEVEYISLRTDGAIFFKNNDGEIRCFNLSPKALAYLKVKDEESANLIASWCKTFIADNGKYIDSSIDVNRTRTWLKDN